MNTPAHVVLNLLCLGKRDRRSILLPVIVGALLPDAPMVIFFIIERFFLNHSQDYIWRTAYFLPHWQHFIDAFNSVPFILLGLGGCLWKHSSIGTLFFLSMLLHVAGDLPLHHDDGHGHFFPFTDWRFVSPVSYWDRDHYGTLMSTLEMIAVIVACGLLIRRYSSIQAKISMGLTGALYLTFFIHAALIWQL